MKKLFILIQTCLGFVICNAQAFNASNCERHISVDSSELSFRIRTDVHPFKVLVEAPMYEYFITPGGDTAMKSRLDQSAVINELVLPKEIYNAEDFASTNPPMDAKRQESIRNMYTWADFVGGESVEEKNAFIVDSTSCCPFLVQVWYDDSLEEAIVLRDSKFQFANISVARRSIGFEIFCKFWLSIIVTFVLGICFCSCIKEAANLPSGNEFLIMCGLACLVFCLALYPVFEFVPFELENSSHYQWLWRCWMIGAMVVSTILYLLREVVIQAKESGGIWQFLQKTRSLNQ